MEKRILATFPLLVALTILTLPIVNNSQALAACTRYEDCPNDPTSGFTSPEQAATTSAQSQNSINTPTQGPISPLAASIPFIPLPPVRDPNLPPLTLDEALKEARERAATQEVIYAQAILELNQREALLPLDSCLRVANFTSQACASKKAEEAEAENSRIEFIKSGSRACSVYPESLSSRCVIENLKYEAIKQSEADALESATIKSKSLRATFDENGSLLVQTKIPNKVDLLTAKINLVNAKGKIVDTGVVRYLTSGEPYLVFDNFSAKGNFKVQFIQPGKKATVLQIKIK